MDLTKYGALCVSLTSLCLWMIDGSQNKKLLKMGLASFSVLAIIECVTELKRLK